MSKELRKKTIRGISWSFVEDISRNSGEVIISIILARLLSPEEFGLLGIVLIFIRISNVIIDSGFSQALIRKNNCTQKDYSTIFYINIILAVLFYLLIFVFSGHISRLFNEPLLQNIFKVLGIILIIDSMHYIQKTIVIKNINFKLEAKISSISILLSGSIGIAMAFLGYGVWSLVAKYILLRCFRTVLYWISCSWRPSLLFSKESFKELFGFGSKILISNVFSRFFENIYRFIIAKFFSVEILGFYHKAKNFLILPSSGLNNIIMKVSYPVLSSFNDNDRKLKSALKKLIGFNVFVSAFFMFLFAIIAKPMVIILLGEQWSTTAQYLSILCYSGILIPFQNLNQNMLNVKGRSDLFLITQLYKKVLSIPAILIGLQFGIISMLYMIVFNSIISSLIISRYTAGLINYNTKEQISDIIPGILITGISAVVGFAFNFYINANNLATLIIAITTMSIFTVVISELLKFQPYIEVRTLIFERLKKIRISSP